MKSQTSLFAVFLFAASSALASPALTSPVSPLSKAGAEAFDTVASAKVYAYSGVGYAGLLPKEVEAMRVLLREQNAASAFQKLLKEATLPGQLFALSGLYLTDRKTFEQAVLRYKNRPDTVEIARGCAQTRTRVSDLVQKHGDNVVRLKPGYNLKDWLAAHPKLAHKGYQLDISGGGVAYMLRGN